MPRTFWRGESEPDRNQNKSIMPLLTIYFHKDFDGFAAAALFLRINEETQLIGADGITFKPVDYELNNYRKVLEIESAGFEVIGGLLREFLNSLTDVSNKARKVKSLLSPHYVVGALDSPDQRYDAILHVVQFVSGMTDTFAIDTYRTIKGIRLPNY